MMNLYSQLCKKGIFAKINDLIDVDFDPYLMSALAWVENSRTVNF